MELEDQDSEFGELEESGSLDFLTSLYFKKINGQQEQIAKLLIQGEDHQLRILDLENRLNNIVVQNCRRENDKHRKRVEEKMKRRVVGILFVIALGLAIGRFLSD